MAERKRKRVSKNKKKSWRKHIDIKDVEDFLEEERIQERTGGLVVEKKDDDLFFVDKSTQENEPASKKSKRRMPKPLRCHASLVLNPNIKPVRITNSVRRPEPRVSKRQLVREAKGIVTKKEQIVRQQRQKAHKEAINKARVKKELPRATYNLWEETGTDSMKDDVSDYHMEKTRKKPVLVPKNLTKKPSSVPAVEVSHPGASYNPTFDDHQDLLRKATVVEEQKLKTQLKLQRALTNKFPSAAEAPTQAAYLEEMSAGLFAEDSDSEGEKEVMLPEDLESTALNPSVRRENKKSEQQRRKDKERRLQERNLKKAKLTKLRLNELNRLKSIKKEVKSREEGLKSKATKKAELRRQNKDKPRKLGKLRYEEKDLELKLSEELQGSLRLLTPEGHLLTDRFKSMQKRNIIETRNRAKFKRKYKLKAVEKREFKDYTLNENRLNEKKKK